MANSLEAGFQPAAKSRFHSALQMEYAGPATEAITDFQKSLGLASGQLLLVYMAADAPLK